MATNNKAYQNAYNAVFSTTGNAAAAKAAAEKAGAASQKAMEQRATIMANGLSGSIPSGTTVIDSSNVSNVISGLNNVSEQSNNLYNELTQYMNKYEPDSQEYRDLSDARDKVETSGKVADRMRESVEAVMNKAREADETVQKLIIGVSVDELVISANVGDKNYTLRTSAEKDEAWRRAGELGLIGEERTNVSNKPDENMIGIDTILSGVAEGTTNVGITKAKGGYFDTTDWNIAESYYAFLGKDRNGNDSDIMQAFVPFLFTLGSMDDYEFRNGVTIGDIKDYLRNHNGSGTYEFDGAGLMGIGAAESTGGGNASNIFGAVNGLGNENRQAARNLAIAALQEMGYSNNEINTMLSTGYGSNGMSAFEQAACVYAYGYNTRNNGGMADNTYGSIDSNHNWVYNKAEYWRQMYENM